MIAVYWYIFLMGLNAIMSGIFAARRHYVLCAASVLTFFLCFVFAMLEVPSIE